MGREPMSAFGDKRIQIASHVTSAFDPKRTFSWKCSAPTLLRVLFGVRPRLYGRCLSAEWIKCGGRMALTEESADARLLCRS
jgi:hypothetical protein